jgi:hypothetical protein
MDNTETTQERASRAVTEEGRAAAGRIAAAREERNAQGYVAPDVSKIEAPAAPLKTPPRTTVGAIEEYTSITPESLQAQRDLQARQATQTATGEDLYSQMLGLGTKGAATIKAEEEAGIGALSTGLTEVENEIAQKALAFRRERERIETAGGSKAQIDTILAEVGRKQNRELADLETIRAARSNTLSNAQNLVDRKIELEFGDKIAQISALKFLYDENKETLNKEDERLFQQTIKREERGFEVAKSKFVQLENEKAKYLTNAAQAGADNNTLKTIQAAQSLDELYTMPGIQKFSMSQAEKLSVALQSEQLTNVREERQARADAAAARAAAIASGALLPEQAETVDAIDSQFRSEPVVKEYNTALAKKAGVDSVINSGVKGVEDLALVYEFMKSVDPTSVVRETEFDNAAKAGNIFQGQYAKYNGYFSAGGGSLPENVRETFRASLNSSFAQKEAQYYNVKSEFGEKVDRRLGTTGGEQYLTAYDAAGSGTLQTDENGNIVIPGKQDNESFWGVATSSSPL